ncbi:MAG: DMT family transporter [Anaerolineae bacterium]|nr:DMT family transporter [Anaerolineae bacterium]
MTGVVWSVLAGVGFGLFQSFNRRAGRGIDVYWSTFILICISAISLVAISLLTEDLTLLSSAPFSAYVNFGLAGLVHFFVGWTLLSHSQRLVGAARTSALLGTIPLFGLVIGIIFFGEFLSMPVLFGITLVLIGVYLVSHG